MPLSAKVWEFDSWIAGKPDEQGYCSVYSPSLGLARVVVPIGTVRAEYAPMVAELPGLLRLLSCYAVGEPCCDSMTHTGQHNRICPLDRFLEEHGLKSKEGRPRLVDCCK